MKSKVIIIVIVLLQTLVSCTENNTSELEGKWRLIMTDADGEQIRKEWSFEGNRFHLDGGNFERYGTFLISTTDQNRLEVIFDYEDPDATVPRATQEVLLDKKNQRIYVGLDGPYNRVE